MASYGDILEIDGVLVEFTPVGYMPVSAPSTDGGMLTMPDDTITPSPTGDVIVKEEPLEETPEVFEEPIDVSPTNEEAITFTFFRGDETGDANPAALWNRGESTQVTQAELEAYFNDEGSSMLRQAFGNFDNYVAYMTERESLIQSGDYDVGNWNEYTGSLTEDELMLLEGEDLTQYGDDASSTYAELEQQRLMEQSSAYDRWINSEANQALLAQYGVTSTIFNNDGDRYEWNGSAYVKTNKVDDNLGFGDVIKAVGAIALSMAVGGAVSGQLAGLLGSTGGAAATGAVQSAIVQGITTGSIDINDMLTAAATAGLMSEFNSFLEESGLTSSVEDQIASYEELAVQYGTESAAGQAAMEAADRLRNALEGASPSLWEQASSSIINFADEAGQLNDVLIRMEENLNEYEDVAWGDTEVSNILGEVTVTLRDYLIEREEEGGGAEASPAEEIVDITQEDTVAVIDDGASDLPADTIETGEQDPTELEAAIEDIEIIQDADIVERQLWEAVIREADPEIRDALIVEWEEYSGRTWDSRYSEQTNPYPPLQEETQVEDPDVRPEFESTIKDETIPEDTEDAPVFEIPFPDNTYEVDPSQTPDFPGGPAPIPEQEPVEPTEPTTPTEPTPPTEPTEPTESTTPTEPTESVPPSEEAPETSTEQPQPTETPTETTEEPSDTPDTGTDETGTAGEGTGTGTGTGTGEGDGDGDGTGTGEKRDGLFGDYKDFQYSIGYQPVQMQQLIAPPKKDYFRELDNLIGRSLFGKMM